MRQALARQITGQYVVEGQTLKVITVSGKVEKIIAEGIQQTEHGNYLSLEPSVSHAILKPSKNKLKSFPLWNRRRLYYVRPPSGCTCGN